MAVDVLVYVEDMGCCTTWLVKGDPFFSGVISIFLSILYAFNTQRERSETPQASRNPEQLHIISLLACQVIKRNDAIYFQKSRFSACPNSTIHREHCRAHARRFLALSTLVHRVTYAPAPEI